MPEYNSNYNMLAELLNITCPDGAPLAAKFIRDEK
ncbi:hypothetical protein EPIR_2090 [Erwinia piriflorinigrans CFBP 5888]|uniref:Uncharacterized protein n=1 Tax=Erwinia piriflorinigrans CFBP 5888 TaxID=1161919 RepID=V5Z938_9GAMM|nr:hypothetical protein EPIR_2090 [Erwinia piriflorinigrans CFBP 5888]